LKQPAVYIMASGRNGTLYAGVTSNLPKRALEHREGVVAGFTTRYGRKLLVWYELHATMTDAIVREKQIKAFDANDWIYQTWAYDRHDVGTTPGMNGDTVKALRAIKAKTLLMTGTKDLLNPEWEPQDAARFIRDVRVSTISPGTVTGHASAGGAFPADVDFLNREISQFLDLVTRNGQRLN